MPAHHTFVCDRCGVPGVTVTGGYQAVVRDTGELVPLPHPAEMAVLAAEGYTFFGAGVRGRYARVQELLCTDCGALHERAQLGFPLGSLMALLLLGALVAAPLMRWRWNMLLSAWSLALLCVASWLLLLPLPGALVRLVYRRRGRALPWPRACEGCGRSSLRTVDRLLLTSAAVPCRACGERACRPRLTAVS